MNFLPEFRFIDSTDVVGFLGKPSSLDKLHHRLWPNHALHIGMEVLATPNALKELESSTKLHAKFAGFHARTQLHTPPKHTFLWVANSGLATGPQLLSFTESLNKTSYILMHNHGYHQLKSAQLLDSYIARAYKTVLIVENDGRPGDLQAATEINEYLGNKNLVIDWLHYHHETGIPFPGFWDVLIAKLTELAPVTAAWHVCVGTRDNLPEIPDHVLQIAKRLKETFDIRVIIEHQFNGLSLIHNKLRVDGKTVEHLRTQYDRLLNAGLIQLN